MFEKQLTTNEPAKRNKPSAWHPQLRMMDFYPKRNGGAERTDWKRVRREGLPVEPELEPSILRGSDQKEMQADMDIVADHDDKRTAAQIDFTKNDRTERTNDKE